MKHLAKIQTDFIKFAKDFWTELSHDEQVNYLEQHPKSKKHILVSSDELKPKFEKLDDRQLELKERALSFKDIQLDSAPYRKRFPIYQQNWVRKQLQAIKDIKKERNETEKQKLKEQDMLATVSYDDVKGILETLEIPKMTEPITIHGTERGHSLQYTPGYQMGTITNNTDSKPYVKILPQELKDKFLNELKIKNIKYDVKQTSDTDKIIIG
jgi:hypothetical protein